MSLGRSRCHRSMCMLASYLKRAHIHMTPDCLQVAAVPIMGKMAGAVGNYNAHISAYPEVCTRPRS